MKFAFVVLVLGVFIATQAVLLYARHDARQERVRLMKAATDALAVADKWEQIANQYKALAEQNGETATRFENVAAKAMKDLKSCADK